MSETEVNDKLAADIQVALVAELKRRNVPYLEASVENTGNVNLDIKIRYASGFGNTDFEYVGIQYLQRIMSEGKVDIESFSRDRVERYLKALRENMDWQYRESSQEIARENSFEYLKESAKDRLAIANKLLKQLKEVKP